MKKWSQASEFVKLGENITIGEYVVLGVIPKMEKITPLEIGDRCIIRSHTVIYTNTKIGNKCQTGHNVLIRENNKIGNNVSIGSHSVIERDAEIEDNVRVHSNVFIPEYTHLKKNAWVGPNVVMTNAYHPLCPKAKECLKGPTIGENAIIGANATILPYIKIGKKAFIGAGAVVTKDVPDGWVAYGNPAKSHKRTEDLECVTNILGRNPYR
ncbi:MAG: DapH/DapD/GlmU-related protein [Candidatus Hodarchaeales archaeon]